MARHRIAWPPRHMRDGGRPQADPQRPSTARKPVIGLFGRKQAGMSPATGLSGRGLRHIDQEAIR